MDKEFISVKLDADLVKKVNRLVSGRDTTRSQWLRESIREKLEREKKLYLVHFRSADGTLNREFFKAVDENDVRNVYRDVVSIELVTTPA